MIKRLTLLAALVLFPAPLLSAESCKNDQKLLSSVARAGLFANMRGAEDSIRIQSEKLLADAFNKASAEGNACCPAKKPLIIFESKPTKFKADYSDSLKCAGYLEATKKSPLAWSAGSYASAKEFADFFGDFSQGKGELGKELYAKCDGDCSPQYHTELTPQDNGSFSADIKVVCGHARDKDDDTYTLTTALKWSC